VERAEIGIKLIRDGISMKKENKGKWIRLHTTSSKYIDIYFANENDEQIGS
jgi:hypothetical protein